MNTARAQENVGIERFEKHQPTSKSSQTILLFKKHVQVSWDSSSGARLHLAATTQILGHDGATVVVARALPVGSNVEIKCNDRRAECLVIGQIGITRAGHICALKFISELPSFWGIAFPPCLQQDYCLLHCTSCGESHSTRLGEVESLCLQTNESVAKICRRCGCAREFRAVEENGALSYGAPADPKLVPLGQEIEHFQRPERVRDDRRHKRVNLKNSRGCVRVPNGTDDVVGIVDVSRGGVKFTSDMSYQVGMWIEMASHYVDGGNNVFVPAKIVCVQRRPTPQLPGEYGIEFKKNSSWSD